MQVTMVGLDLGKRVFQLHGVDAVGRVVVRRKLQRAEVGGFFAELAPCLVRIEACATAHYWSRVIASHGYPVRLMPPAYVKSYVRRSKNDAADAEAICEAVGRPSMRFCADEISEPASRAVTAPGTRSTGPPTDDADQRATRTPRRIWDYRTSWPAPSQRLAKLYGLPMTSLHWRERRCRP
jgi:hypothetical protein